MKNLNLIKRLWTDSHEKQSPQRFTRYAAMLFMLLTLGVGQMWGASEGSNWNDATSAKVYFDNTNSSYSNVSMLIGRQWSYGDLGDDGKKGSWGINFSLVSGTNNLYYASVTGQKYNTFCFINAADWGWKENETVTSRLGYCTNTNTPNDNLGSSTHLYVPASGSDNASVTHTTPASYTALNYTQTLYQCVAENGGTPAKSTTSIGTISIETKKLNGNSSTTNDNGSIASGQNNVAKSAARTATVTMTATSIKSGYTFLGWYDSETGGTRLENSTTYTYQATAAKTVYARFSHETTHSVTIYYKCGSIAVASQTSQAIGQVTASSITAPTVYGYTFTGWTLNTGISNQSASTSVNPISVKTLSSGTYNMTANYTEDLTSTWYVSGAAGIFGGWGSSGKNMQRKTGHSTEKRFYYTIDATRVINGETSDSNLEFKIYNSDGASYRGNNGYWVTRSNYQPTLSSESGNNMQFRPDAYGTYEFKVDCESPYSESAPKLTVTFGTKRQVTFGKRTGCKTVTAKYNNTVSMTSGQYVINGSSVTFSQTANEGYTFEGWYNAPSGGTKQSASATYTLTISGGNKTIYPNYTINNHAITHSASSNGTYTIKVGDASAVSTNTTADYNQTVVLAATPATGYHFTGWTVTKKGGGSVTVTSNQFSMPDDDVTVSATFAINSYTVHFDGNGATSGSMSNQTGIVYNSATTLTANAFERTGYTFQGWATSSERAAAGTVDRTDGEVHGNLTLEHGVTVNLYAVWTPNKYKIFIENYDPIFQGTLRDCLWPDDEDKPYLVVTFGTSNLDCYVNAVPTKLPYEFGGWYSGEAGSGDQIFGNTGFLVDGATVYTDASGNWKQASNVTLYAKWIQSSASSNIYIDRHSGTGGAITAVYNAAALASFTASTREGYIFQGYFTAAEGGNKIINVDGTLVANVGSYTDAAHKWIYAGSTPTIHAQWVPITYTIAFAKNNDPSYYGSETGDNPTPIAATYDVNATMPENTYSRTGYHFIGWATEAHKAKGSCPGVDYDYAAGGTARNLSSTQGATVTLYPKWLGNTHTISFNARGGYVSQTSSNITFDETYGSGTGLSGNLPIPTPPSGYEFSGWYTASEGGTEVTKDDKMHTDGDHTLYAHYVRKDRVYFKNTLGWENVYVTWDAEWNHGDQDKGAGASGKTQELMNHIYGTDIWYKDIPAAILSDWAYNIAFTSKAMDNYEWFDDGEAVFRRDFDKKATMFVPKPNDSNKFLKNKHGSKPGTLYYSTAQAEGDPQGRYKNGYWVKYNDLQAGYDLKGSWNWVEHHYIERPNPEDSVYIFTIQGLSANTTYQFKLYKDVEVNNTGSEFSSTTSITSATAPDAAIFNAANGGSNASMKTTVAGDYTFKFNFSALGEVKLTVDYPFAVNDYKVVYSYTKDGAKTFESQYIKARANGIDTISMFIHSGDCATSRSLKIHKCTDISASGVATWNTSYASIALPTETASGKTSGVYNIQISQNESSAATGECVGRYEGQYYIRSQAADGGWDQYKVHADNLMTLSEYSLKQTLSAPYSHYFCKYIDNSTTEVTFTIATDYSPSICPVMVGDETIGGLANKTLPEGKSASVRFMWNEETNATGRSYLKSAQGPRNVRFLVLHGAADDMIFNNDATGTAIPASGDLAKNEKIFEDTENWVYECYIKAKPGAKVSLIAKYNELDRYLIGGPSSWETIIGGTGGSKYIMKVVYDFKTNRLMTAWVPSEGITEKLSNIDVIIERHNQDGATTITFKKATEESEAGSIEAKSVIGALRFDYDELVGCVASWTPDTRAKMMFLVSFPFDVNISDIFGLNTNYGEAFIVQQYNGAKRAEKGFFQLDGTDTFWETLPVDSVMHAGVGYCVCMDNDYLNNDVGHLWDNKKAGSSIYLYFPSANGDIVINSDPKTVHVPAHECKINRTFNGGKLNHKYTDSNWNMMGIPIFQNHTGDKDAAGTPGAIFTPDKDPSDTTDYKPGIGFFYKWSTDKSYSVQKAQGYVFQPMHGYLVQYAGDVTFTCAAPEVASVAARRIPLEEDYELELQVLNANEEVLNRTYVELREEACDTFALNEDLYLAMNKHDVNVYTFAGTYNVAANVLSVDNHIVPMGVVVRKEGTYTFSMPDNFSGEVILVDKSAQTRTNLAMTDYEIHLPAGTIDDRFELEINIHKVPTAIDGAKAGEGTLKDGKVHKFIMNDQMYILKDGVLYDARGNRVK